MALIFAKSRENSTMYSSQKVMLFGRSFLSTSPLLESILPLVLILMH